MASKKLRNQLAAQAWMAQTEAEWREREIQEKGSMRKEQEVAFDYKAHLNRMYLLTDQLFIEMKGLQREMSGQIKRILRTLAIMTFLFILQIIAMAFLIWKAVRP